ncbi:glycosyltransferase family 2 protein [Agromyces sp. Marseille-P2726]|uniref:glycosyltransferase family 2 protein n=1 Tax=Agromyces sp. Marseille-P2726 TaxID=2709132 RepID=UPI00157003A6|nr:glycosyltransferase family 2 protein [Agromyces sp. Marseille-P2726]
MRLNHLAVVMPAYNEAAGIPGFVSEVHDSLTPLAELLEIVVIDDRSTDATAGVLRALAKELPGITVVTAEANRGHGATALAAYRAGLERHPDLIVHVDGDGQFTGADLARVVAAAVDTNADVVHGVRVGRSDPWFRRVLTAIVGGLVAVVAGRRIPDVNTPLRAYRPEALEALVASVPVEASVPHVHFSLAEVRRGCRVRYVRVRSLPRRGGDEQGTMWGAAPHRPPLLPPKRLRQFVRGAAVELWSVSLKPRRRG